MKKKQLLTLTVGLLTTVTLQASELLYERAHARLPIEQPTFSTEEPERSKRPLPRESSPRSESTIFKERLRHAGQEIALKFLINQSGILSKRIKEIKNYSNKKKETPEEREEFQNLLVSQRKCEDLTAQLKRLLTKTEYEEFVEKHNDFIFFLYQENRDSINPDPKAVPIIGIERYISGPNGSGVMYRYEGNGKWQLLWADHGLPIRSKLPKFFEENPYEELYLRENHVRFHPKKDPTNQR